MVARFGISSWKTDDPEFEVSLSILGFRLNKLLSILIIPCGFYCELRIRIQNIEYENVRVYVRHTLTLASVVLRICTEKSCSFTY